MGWVERAWLATILGIMVTVMHGHSQGVLQGAGYFVYIISLCAFANPVYGSVSFPLGGVSSVQDSQTWLLFAMTLESSVSLIKYRCLTPTRVYFYFIGRDVTMTLGFCKAFQWILMCDSK